MLPYKKIWIMLICVVLLLSSCTAPTDDSADAAIGLPEQEINLLKQAFYEYYANKDELIRENCTPDSVSVIAYYGTYNGVYVVSITMPYLISLGDSITIDGVVLQSGSISVYNGETWMSLQAAYTNGYLTKEALVSVADRVNARYMEQMAALESHNEAIESKMEAEKKQRIAAMKESYFNQYVKGNGGTSHPQITVEDLCVLSSYSEGEYVIGLILGEGLFDLSSRRVTENDFVCYNMSNGEILAWSEAVERGILTDRKFAARARSMVKYCRKKIAYYVEYAQNHLPGVTLEALQLHDVYNNCFIAYSADRPLGVNHPPRLEDVYYWDGDSFITLNKALSEGLLNEEALRLVTREVERIGASEG